MKTNSDSTVFSLRIVSIDNYMKAPVFGLDTCYSEFRADEVKQVPVIRIFGTDAKGTKTCAHVHGVFPYLYVPYDGGDATGDSDRLAYQLASSLDKAINISLGQTNSNAQHVFKIILVKAKPFYGYHKTEHKFLKIFLYNPVFIRRAANLLQNGAILGRVFQPHESHVPYILQFMIDYNLYGMSFMYIPIKLVRYRQQSRAADCEFSINGDIELNDDCLRNIEPNQILDRKIDRMSTSKQEIDVSAAVILNRFQISMNDEENEHANPGIAFLWSDERGRRQKMDGTPAPMVPTPEASQDRDIPTSVASELFHQAALNRRLEQFRSESPSTQSSDSILDQTINRSNANRKFDLNQFIQNSVYPAELTSNDEIQLNDKHILNASFLIDHLKAMKTTPAQSTGTQSSVSTTKTHSQEWDSVQFDPNETFVDEELVLSLTQKLSNQTLMNETLNENEHEVLDIFELMEQDETAHDDTLRIDDDSVLAPLSQKETKQYSQPKNRNDESNQIASFEDEDSDDNLLNEFSMSILDCLSDEQQRVELKIPQLDGAFDSPKKKQSACKKSAIKANARSPSRSAKKYSPLDIVISKTATQQKTVLEARLCLERCDLPKSKLSTYTISETAAICQGVTQARRTSISQNKTNELTTLNESQQQQQQQETELPSNQSEQRAQQKTPLSSQPHQHQQQKQQQINSPSSFEVPKEYRHIFKKLPVVKLIRYKNIEETFNGKIDKVPSPTILSSTSSQSNMQLNDEKNSSDTKQDKSTKKRKRFSSDEDDEIVETTSESTPNRRYPRRELKKDLANIIEPSSSSGKSKSRKPPRRNKDEIDELNKMDFWYSWYNWSDCKLSDRYDEERQFYPQPGPSNLNYYEEDKIPGYFRPIQKKIQRKTSGAVSNKQSTPLPSSGKKRSAPILSPSQRHSLRKAKTPKLNGNTSNGNQLTPLSDNSDWECDIHVQSFYEQSIMENLSPLSTKKSKNNSISPVKNGIKSGSESLVNTTFSTPQEMKILENFANELKIRPKRKTRHDSCFIKPVNDSPCPREIINSHEIPKVINKVPFYSDPNDVLAHNSKKEIGNTVLQLNGCSVNDYEEFKSNQNVVGMSSWQHVIGLNAMRTSRRVHDTKALNDQNSMRQFLARDKPVQVTTNKKPPSPNDAKKWLNTRKRANKKKCDLNEIIDLADDDEYPEKNNDKNIKNIAKRDNRIDKPSPKQNCDEVVRKLRSRKDITVSIVSKPIQSNILKSQSDDQNTIVNNFDDDDDDVVFVNSSISQTSVPSIKEHRHNSLAKLSDSQLENSKIRAQLNLDDTISRPNSTELSFGIDGGPLENSFGFRLNLENFQCAKSNIEHNYLTILSLDIHCQTRSTLLPDPAHDEIVCIFYEIHNDVPPPLSDDNSEDCLSQQASGVIINTNQHPDVKHLRMATQTRVTLVNTEKDLFMELVRLIRKWDPDIFAGYEIELASWGYVIQRSQAINVDLVPLISRIPSQRVAKFKQTEDENQQHEEFIGFEYDSEYKLHGRILLDVWRLLRPELALTSYSFENIMYHVMHRRCPLYSHEKLTRLWNESINRWIVVEYYLNRVKGTLEILNQLDLIGRTCELAKLFGIQFYEVLSRGSQFRVESMMLRIAKPKNLIPVSPSVQQRAHMRAPEYLPLIMEPHSRFYSDPLIVLDFQSLYPSMIIAYNYCFSTCLGRVEHLGQSQPFEMGAWQLRVPRRLIEKLSEKNLITISPCGVVFVKSSVREGVLPRMLREILDTRLMVKQSMKLHKDDKLLQRILHSRQLGLKLMANVTYGYTAANFSGRMPCVEVGDSVVSKGRETLERAIRTVEENKEWGVKVVYGDTDSMFVLVPGRSRADAFRIGNEIADTITKQNPFPVRLKLEKVYQPSILQTKKRYVGYMYETPEQNSATYEAKGIETVRRDGCPAVAKMLEKTLRILFETYDVSAVKRYICKQFTKILSGRANVQDLIFAKEFRGVNGYKPGACVPSLELTRAALQIDRRAEPRRGERVPYLVINGPPGLPLIRLVRSPHEYLANEALKINAMYYITKVIIPPLNRCLLLLGADVNQWFADLPRKSQYILSLDVASNILSRPNHLWSSTSDKSLAANVKKSTISQYFSSTNCVCDCGEHTQNGICSKCLEPQHARESVFILTDKCMQLERKVNLCMEMCSACCGQLVDTKCMSLDCSVLFMLNRWKRESNQIQFYRQLLSKYF